MPPSRRNHGRVALRRDRLFFPGASKNTVSGEILNSSSAKTCEKTGSLSARRAATTSWRGLPYDVEDKGWTSFSAGKVVLVDVGSLQLKKGNQVISWTTPPENPIRFVQKDRVRGALYVREQGVFYTCGLMVTVR